MILRRAKYVRINDRIRLNTVVRAVVKVSFRDNDADSPIVFTLTDAFQTSEVQLFHEDLVEVILPVQ